MSTFYPLHILEVKKETPNAISVVFDIPTKLKNTFSFKAGQYITLKTIVEGTEVRRAYSICSSPSENEFRISVKAVENGLFSNYACENLKKGDIIDVAPPEGKFVLNTNSANKNNYLALAAGSGITPILSMIKDVLTNEPSSSFTLIYGNRTVNDTIFKSTLDKLAYNHSANFNIKYIYSREEVEGSLHGRIDADTIEYLLQNNFNSIPFNAAFLCGPEGMISMSRTALEKVGFTDETIFYELFTSPALTDETEEISTDFNTCSVSVILDEEETSFEMNPEETLLSASINQGLDAPYSCQGGICSSCIAKVTEGKAVMTKNTVLSEKEIEDGFILTCQAHPTTKKIVIDFDDV